MPPESSVVTTTVKQSLRSVAHGLGFDIRRLSINAHPSVRLLRALERFHIDLVLDVGANTGQFASELRSVGYTGRIVSFEPLPDAHARLTASAARHANWTVHTRTAIGDRDGDIIIHVAGNSASSSALPMLAAHADADATSRYVGSTSAPVQRLDAVSGPYLATSRAPFVKIDTQGYEWQVLDGASETMARAAGVMCEVSLVPLYDGQRLWRDLLARLEGDGFTLWALQTGFTDPRDGRTLQLDAVFFRQPPDHPAA